MKTLAKLNIFLEVLQFNGPKIVMRINVKKVKSIRLGISEG